MPDVVAAAETASLLVFVTLPSSGLDRSGDADRRDQTTIQAEQRPAAVAGSANVAAGGRRRWTQSKTVVLVLLVVIDALVVAAVVMFLGGRSTTKPSSSDWTTLDPTARCARAVGLISHPTPWPILCRWRTPGETTQGVSFPPPAGDPPWDRPRIEVHVDAGQDREELARVIAHEMGHMHHTREPSFASEWLQARKLPPDTDWTIWVEDYAEVFAKIFGPTFPDWRAPTLPPTPAELASLRARFFQ